MIFFHISDLHIGKQLHFYSLKEDQKAILCEIGEYAEKLKPQAIVIAGDVYDKSVPSAEAVAVFDGFLRKLADTGTETIIVSGNHDSPERLEFASFLLEREHVHIAGMPPVSENDHLKRVMLEDEYGKVCFWLLPFLKPAYVRGVFPGEEPDSFTEAVKKILLREERDETVRNVLVSHQFYTAAGEEPSRSDSETVYVGGAGNVDISAADGFEYGALGHIHRAQYVGKQRENGVFRYCGTPLKYSAGESGDAKTLTVVTLGGKGQAPGIEELPLHPLRDVKQLRGTLKELLEMGCGDYVSLTMTDDRQPYHPRERLEKVFPNILELKVDNIRTRQQLSADGAERISADPMELFGKFYQEIHGQAMNGDEENIIREIFERAEVDKR